MATLAMLLLAILLCGAADVRAQSRVARMAVWDTARASALRRSSADLEKRDAWVQKTRGQLASSFAGDAVLSNGHILAVVRKRGSTIDVYSGESGSPVARVQLRLRTHAGDAASRLQHMELTENSRSAARLSVAYTTDKANSIAATIRLKRGDVFLEVAPGPGAGLMRIDATSRYVVLPDFFADDILVDAANIPVHSAEIPSENFLLQLIDDGNAIAMCVFEKNSQDVRVTFTGKGTHRIATGAEIPFGDNGKIWVAILATPHIWYEVEVKDGDAGKIMPLDWKTPFPAQWRIDFTCRNELVDSWEMLYPATEGEGFIKPSWLPAGTANDKPSRTATGEIDVDAYKVGGPASNRLGPDRQRWITFLGRFLYPCWTDTQNRAYIQPLKHRDPKKQAAFGFRGPAVIYPINRLPATPIDTYTIVDVMRGTLGVGPCEYILNVEGQNQAHVGRATCHVRRLLNEIYEKGQQKAKGKEIDIYLNDGLDFVTHIRNRITCYIEFGHAMRQYLVDQKTAHPELKSTLAKFEKTVGQLDERLEARRDAIKSPAYVARMNDAFRKNLKSYDGPDALKRLKKYTDTLTHIGGNQDELVGECRRVVRTLRQQAALALAVDPRCAAIAKEIRARTQKVLLKPSAYEGARH